MIKVGNDSFLQSQFSPKASETISQRRFLLKIKMIHISILSYSLNLVRKHLKRFLEKVLVKITQFRVCPSSVSIDYTLLLGARSCSQYSYPYKNDIYLDSFLQSQFCPKASETISQRRFLLK
jgi:hypothetical protein